jgi:glucosamine-6-phosphate deaminase
MNVRLCVDATTLADAAADHAAASIRNSISAKGLCRVVVATGASQFPFLDALTAMQNVDWPKVEAFHLDEYVGIPKTHRGSFRRMLMERFVEKTGITRYHFVEGDAADLAGAVRDIGMKLTAAPVDLVFVGIGENGHIAFNDPPADFDIDEPYIVVELDEACRRQQVGESWFPGMASVPKQAISMSVRQILKAREIIAVVPDQRKANAVKMSLEGEIGAMAPASILRRHADTTMYLDLQSASLLSTALREKLENETQVKLSS